MDRQPRIEPARSPFPPRVHAWLDRVMPDGMEPLVLFTTLARDERLFDKFMSGGLLDRGNLSLRQREIIIHRTTALCGSDYEWGVHAALFAGRAGLSEAELGALAQASSEHFWPRDEALLIQLCDALHASCDLSDALWRDLAARFPPEAILEMLMLAGFYRTIAYLTNGLRLPLEPGTKPIAAAARTNAL